MARPRAAEPRSELLSIPLRETEKRLVESAARREDFPVAVWSRRILIDAAKAHEEGR